MTIVAAAVSGEKQPIAAEGLLVWAYRTQLVYELVGAQRDADRRRLGHGRDSAIACQVNGLLGATIDDGDWTGPERPDQVDDDAVAVHEAVASLGGPRDWLLIRHARDVEGGRPLLDDGPVVRWAPLLTRIRNDLSEEPVYQYSAGYRGGKKPWYCLLELVDVSGPIDDSRQVWRDWRAALADLAELLRREPGRLTRWRVTDSLPEAEPWNAPEKKSRKA